MNFLKVVLLLTIVTLCAASKQDEVCAWQNNVTALVGKLTPAGQKLALQVATDFWAIFLIVTYKVKTVVAKFSTF